MQARKDAPGYWLVLEKGEEIKATAEAWTRGEGIAGASISGVGAVTEAELGAYDHSAGKYARKKFGGHYELLSLCGNINSDGLHAHVVLSNADFKAFGGHLFSAKISVVGEFFVVPTAQLAKVQLEGTPFRKIDLGKTR